MYDLDTDGDGIKENIAETISLPAIGNRAAGQVSIECEFNPLNFTINAIADDGRHLDCPIFNHLNPVTSRGKQKLVFGYSTQALIPLVLQC